MPAKKIYINLLITVLSTLILSLLAWVIWRSDNNNEYESLSKSIHVFFAYFIAVVAGVITFVRIALKKTTGSIGQNFIGTFNIVISAVGCMFVYHDTGSLLSTITLAFLITFCMGLFILEDVYFNKHNKLRKMNCNIPPPME